MEATICPWKTPFPFHFLPRCCILLSHFLIASTAYKICRQYFETWVISEHGQNLFGSFNETPEGATRKKVFYSLFNDSICMKFSQNCDGVVDSEMKESLDSILEHHIDGQQTWHAIERLLTPKTREKSLVVLV